MIYDAFISYKSSDYAYVKKIFDELKKIDPSLNIFMAELSLKEIGQAQYTEAIEEAIKSSRNMIVVATKEEYFSSKWVNYEWRLFFHFQLNDKNSFYKNIVTVTNEVDYSKLPDALQLCESIRIEDYDKIYRYVKNINQNLIAEELDDRKHTLLSNSLARAGWGEAILFSAEQLSLFESKITPELKSVTIISHTIDEDAPGGALFDTVEKNLLKGISYNYIFLDADNAKSVLKKIFYGHSNDAKKHLKLEKARSSFWVLGEYANVTIYEFINGPMSGYFRIKTEITRGVMKSIYIRLSEQIIDRIQNQIEDYRENGEIKQQYFEG